MMTELAPQDSEGGYNRPKYDFPKDPLADETVVIPLSAQHRCSYIGHQTGLRGSKCTVDFAEKYVAWTIVDQCKAVQLRQMGHQAGPSQKERQGRCKERRFRFSRLTVDQIGEHIWYTS